MGAGGFNPMLLGPLLKILFSKTGLVLVGIFLAFSFFTGKLVDSFIERHQIGLQPGDMLGQAQLGTPRQRQRQAVDVEPDARGDPLDGVIPTRGHVAHQGDGIARAAGPPHI